MNATRLRKGEPLFQSYGPSPVVSGTERRREDLDESDVEGEDIVSRRRFCRRRSVGDRVVSFLGCRGRAGRDEESRKVSRVLESDWAVSFGVADVSAVSDGVPAPADALVESAVTCCSR